MNDLKSIQEMAAEILQKRAERAENEKARIIKDRRQLLARFIIKNPVFYDVMKKSEIETEIRRSEIDQFEVWLCYKGKYMKLCILNPDPYRPEHQISMDILLKAEHMVLFINENLIKTYDTYNQTPGQ